MHVETLVILHRCLRSIITESEPLHRSVDFDSQTNKNIRLIFSQSRLVKLLKASVAAMIKRPRATPKN